MSRFLHSVDRVMIVDGDDIKRAPMAAALIQQFANQDPLLRLWGTRIESAGAGVTTNEGVHPGFKAKNEMLKNGLNISSHQAKQITLNDMRQSSIILTVAPKHSEDVFKNDVLDEYPSYKTKVIPLLNYVGKDWEFPELLGANQSAYAEFVKLMVSLLPSLKVKLRQDTRLPLLLRGQGLGPGLVQGKVRIIETTEQAGEIEKGDVVVCHTNHLDGLLGRYFNVIGAIITNSESEMMNLSQTSNEFNIPCVGGTSDATEILQNGQAVWVDANAGSVYGSLNIFIFGQK